MSTPAAPTSAGPKRVDAAGSSVVPGVPGVPWWAAVAIGVVFAAVGAIIDGITTDAGAGSVLGWGFRIGFVGGVALAALAVRRRAIFTAMVQPPLISIVVAAIAQRLIVKQKLTETLIHLVDTFPVMAVGTAAAVLIGLIRIFAQPLRPRGPARARQPQHT